MLPCTHVVVTINSMYTVYSCTLVSCHTLADGRNARLIYLLNNRLIIFQFIYVGEKCLYSIAASMRSFMVRKRSGWLPNTAHALGRRNRMWEWTLVSTWKMCTS